MVSRIKGITIVFLILVIDSIPQVDYTIINPLVEYRKIAERRG